VKATPEPSRAAPTATAVKEKEKDKDKEKEKERRPTPVPTAPRRDSNDHGGQSGDNHNQSSKGHQGG
jgi:hypothetical protein